MDFIQLFADSISRDTCQEILKRYMQSNSSEKKARISNLNATVEEYSLTDKSEWSDLEIYIQDSVEKKVKTYLSFNHTVSLNTYLYGHMTIMHHRQDYNIPVHYDSEYVNEEGEEKVRSFAVLTYLNDNFDGGELIFPLQKKVIKPKTGLSIIFPTSFMYPHVTNPALGQDRYVLRSNYFINKNHFQTNQADENKLSY